VTERLPKLQSFRGKRITATSTYLFERLGWSATTVKLYQNNMQKICSPPHPAQFPLCCADRFSLGWNRRFAAHSSRHLPTGRREASADQANSAPKHRGNNGYDRGAGPKNLLYAAAVLAGYAGHGWLYRP
jgi:hypothetical protein